MTVTNHCTVKENVKYYLLTNKNQNNIFVISGFSNNHTK